MMSRIAWFRITALTVLTILPAAETWATRPHYLIVETESAQPRRGHRNPVPSATFETRVAQPYAYGWFGAQPRRHATRHFGYYRTYTEWSSK